jgi:hypothetical protein
MRSSNAFTQTLHLSRYRIRCIRYLIRYRIRYLMRYRIRYAGT